MNWFKSKQAPSNLKCPYCGGSQWYAGPSAGLSTNVLCGNPDCRHWFNHTPAIGLLDDLHQMEPTDEEKETDRTKAGIDSQKAIEMRREEGRQAFLAGESIDSLRKDRAYGGYAEASSNIDRICGFIDEMNREACALCLALGLVTASHPNGPKLRSAAPLIAEKLLKGD